jgi:F0F1-type ATP synthase epsilon subunit
LAELGSGELSYVTGGHRRSMQVEGGWLEVSNDHARVLATSAQKRDE